MNITKHFDPNMKGRDFVCGDLHGCFNEFRAAITGLEFDFNRDRMFSVGDLVDRGPKSLECLELIQEPWFHAVRGNHEDMMLSFNIDRGLLPIKFGVWKSQGGLWSPKPPDELLQLTLELPFIMVVHKADGTRINIIHAEFPDECTDRLIDSEKFETDELEGLLWKRSRSYAAMGRRGAMANSDFTEQLRFLTLDQGLSRSYMGHTPITVPVTLGSYNFIDTGLVFGKKLTIVEL